MTIFQKEVQEVRRLNNKYKSYWEREFAYIDHFEMIANPDNFEENVFFHQANSEEEKESIFRNGFNLNKVGKNNSGVGAGLYLGRDKNALIHFYDPGWGDSDYIIKIVGDFNFYDGIRHSLPQNPTKVLEQGFDGIRYYDPDATGEEFVLFNLKKVIFTI